MEITPEAHSAEAVARQLSGELMAAQAAAGNRLGTARRRFDNTALVYQLRVGMRARVMDEVEEALLEEVLTNGWDAAAAELGTLLNLSGRDADAFERGVIECQQAAAREFISRWRQFIPAHALLAALHG